jgi:hypothetical protein
MASLAELERQQGVDSVILACERLTFDSDLAG